MTFLELAERILEDTYRREAQKNIERFIQAAMVMREALDKVKGHVYYTDCDDLCIAEQALAKADSICAGGRK